MINQEDRAIVSWSPVARLNRMLKAKKKKKLPVVTRQIFGKFRDLQYSGRCNMANAELVASMAGITKKEAESCRDNYDTLMEAYGEYEE